MTSKENIIFSIGNPRSGSTWVYRQLQSHPQIWCRAKDINYFNKQYIYRMDYEHYKKSEKWYLNQFKPLNGQICADASVLYFMDKEAHKRIHKFNPDAKIVITIRNPYEGVYSHYRQLHHIYNIKEDFLEFIKINKENFLEGNRIFEPLSRYLSLFPRENLLICTFDELQNDSRNQARRLYKFLGVEAGFESDTLFKKVNRRKKIKSKTARNVQSFLTVHFRRNSLLRNTMDMFYKFVNPEIIWRLQGMNMDEGENLYRELKPEEKKILVNFYQEDLEKFLKIPEFHHLNWGPR